MGRPPRPREEGDVLTDTYRGPRADAGAGSGFSLSVRIRPPGTSPVAISTAIQTHPRRLELAAELARTVGGEVVLDPDPDARLASPWRTYRRALEETPDWATHRLILQDDAAPCRGFAEAARRAISTRPESPAVFFVAGQPQPHVLALRRASDRGEHWAFLDHRYWLPVIAVAWPRELVASILEYVDAQGWGENFRSDDEILGRFLRARRVRAIATVPSLVQHPDVVESLIGRRASGGANRARVASCLISDDCDPLSIDWTLGPSG